MDGLHHRLEHRVEELPCFLGIALRQELGRALEVRQENRDVLALALEREARAQDPLGEVLRDVRRRRRGA